jgi:putative transposase
LEKILEGEMDAI